MNSRAQETSQFNPQVAFSPASRYGKIVGMVLGSNRFVLIYDFAVAKEAFGRDEFSGRPDNHFTR